MSLPGYAKCSPSGVAWLGSLPTHWKTRSLGSLTKCLDGRRVPLNAEQRAKRPGDVPYWGANSIVDYVDEALFDEDLVLLGEDGAPFLDRTRPVAFFSQGRVWPNNHVHVLRAREGIWPSFIAHALNATDYGSFISGSTRDKLTQAAMSAIPVPIPPLTEQMAIATFLDREVAKIEKLIAQQEKLIALLADKQRSIAALAVARGVRPKPAMKASEVTWIGDMPAHWQLSRLAALFRESSESGGDDLPILSVSIHNGVSDKELDEAEAERKVTRSDDRSKYKAVMPGDLVYNMMRAWQGGVGAVTVHGQVSPAYVVARPISEFLSDYVETVLRTPNAITEIKRNSRGITDFRLRLYWDDFKAIRIPLPPMDEQRAILAFVRTEGEKVSVLAAEAARAISLLGERRAAVLAAAVTGQVDVRAEVPAAPQSTARTLHA